MTERRQRGFSLTEVMVVVAILGIAAALTVPAFDRMQTNSRAKTSARMISNAFQLARTQAILSESQHLVMWTAGAGQDACGTALPSPIVIVDDANADCCINAGETVINVSSNPASEFAGLNWGVTFATQRVPEDIGRGGYTTGSSFSDALGAQTQWVAFRNDGVPVGYSNTCAIGQVGTGGGGVYMTNGGGGTGDRDYAVILSALGAPKVYGWNTAGNAWTN